jgi:hypothetical protein
MGQPHEDLRTLYEMSGRLEELGEMAKTLGLDNGGEAGSITRHYSGSQCS